MNNRDYVRGIIRVERLYDTEKSICVGNEFEVDDFEYSVYATIYTKTKTIKWDTFKEKKGEIIESLEEPYTNTETPQEVKEFMQRFEHDLLVRGYINKTTDEDLHTVIIHITDNETNHIKTLISEYVINIYLSIWSKNIIVEELKENDTIVSTKIDLKDISGIEIDDKLIDFTDL